VELVRFLCLLRPALQLETPMSIANFKHLQIDERLIETLKPFPHNARTHTKKQINQIAASIHKFGFTNRS